ncbi:Tetraspanin-2 [Tupaia chinensis]|uniref:Tetraspanin-2 n=1 Tax=Tupaia chinensis TaxID=246437 RepID=L9KQS1_TUPCH|nr:Tetraspanin-2 [Tupaia chinensis]
MKSYTIINWAFKDPRAKILPFSLLKSGILGPECKLGGDEDAKWKSKRTLKSQKRRISRSSKGAAVGTLCETEGLLIKTWPTDLCILAVIIDKSIFVKMACFCLVVQYLSPFKYVENDGNGFNNRGLYVLVGAGALMMAVGFFGCCGAMRESQCVLGSFFTCLLVIFAAEVTTGVFAFIGKSVAIRHVQTMYEEAYNDYLKDRTKGNGTLITFHATFQCCGKESSLQVQPTCPKELLGHKNCIDEIETVINVKLQLIGIVGIGIAGLTIFGMIFSMVLCCAIRNSRDVI